MLLTHVGTVIQPGCLLTPPCDLETPRAFEFHMTEDYPRHYRIEQRQQPFVLKGVLH